MTRFDELGVREVPPSPGHTKSPAAIRGLLILSDGEVLPDQQLQGRRAHCDLYGMTDPVTNSVRIPGSLSANWAEMLVPGPKAKGAPELVRTVPS
jgi:hypothetical protein